MEKRLSAVTLDWCCAKSGRRFYGRKIEEYIADFDILSRRELSDELYRIFRYYFVLGADWRLCCRYLKLDKGDLFHRVYRIEEILGQAFRETKPYALFPLDEYFGGTSGVRRKPADVSAVKNTIRGSRARTLPVSPLRKIA